MSDIKVSLKGNKIKEIYSRINLKDLICIILGAFLLGIGTNLFFTSSNLVTGGVIGIGIILKHFLNIPVWVTNLVINVPLFVIAYFAKGKKWVINSIIGTAALTFILWFSEDWTINSDSLFLNSLYGGLITGAGLGLVVRGNGTTGGTDLITIVLRKFVPFLTFGQILRVIEISIIISGAYVFGLEKAMFAIIAIFVSSKAIDYVNYGDKAGYAVYIFSKNHEKMSEEILHVLNRGVTMLNAVGGYSKESTSVLLCVISKKELPLLKRIVNMNDNQAFVIINETKEVVGNGFWLNGMTDY